MPASRTLRIALPLAVLVLLGIWCFQDQPKQKTTKVPVQGETRSTDLTTVENPAGSGHQDLQNWAHDFSNRSSDLATGIELAKQRRARLKALIQTDPQAALAMRFTAKQRTALPDEIIEFLEIPISAAGEFELIATCYTGELRKPADAPELERFVTIGDQRYRAFTFGRRSELQTKDRISLHGIAIDDALALSPDPVQRVPDAREVVAEAFGETKHFANEDALERYTLALLADENALGAAASPLDDGDDGGDPPTANSAWTEGAKRILYLRVRFADQDPAYEPITLASAQSRQADVEEHFRVASYGKMTLTTVFPDTISLSENKSEYVGSALGTMMNEARDLAITMGQAEGEDWDYNNYEFYTIVSDGGIGSYAGVAQVGGRKSHLQSTSLRTAGHEFGHNFGLSHAYYNYTSDLSPRGATPYDGLRRVEYGHRFSIMSAQSGSDFNHPLIPHFTVHEKWRLDWLTDADMTDITAGNQSGTYRLYQDDADGATGQRALRIPSGGTLPKYWLSYRTAWKSPNRSSDNDYLLNGIVFDWTGSGGGTSTLLDMTPYSDDGSHSGADWTRDNSDKWDAPLLIGRTYTDSESRVSVTPIARGGSAPDEYIDVFVHLDTGVETPLVAETDACRVIIPNASTATNWTEGSYDDSGWPFSGPLGVGYDEQPDYDSFIGVDVEAAMNNTNASCYIRVPFTIDAATNPADIAALKLRMRYDDGFVAYINGVKVAEANAPITQTWNSGATSNHGDGDAVQYEEFSANAALGSLVSGTNVLAIHGLNNGSGSSDFLIQPELNAVLSAATNTPPTVTLNANSLVAGVGQAITFTASGADNDGDTLAYSWDFDIGDTFAPEGLNAPVAQRSWSSAGLYAVTVTCSDRKGGTAAERVMVKIGSPSADGFITGRVLRGGQPVAGARVSIDGTDTGSITLADGSYVIAGVSTTPITLSARLDGETFEASTAMPISAAPTLVGIDFFAQSSAITEAPAQALTVSPHDSATEINTPLTFTALLWDNTVGEDQLIPLGDNWTYLDTGVDPGTTWIDAAFDDSAWLTGAAELGYGDDQTTEIDFGGDSSNKHVTSWFRRGFNAANVTEVSRLKLSIKRDDGVRVFLNGTEIARDNLTTGTVSATTTARDEISSSDEATLITFAVDPALLLEGANVLAAEVHQEDADSSDLSFDLELSAARNLTPVTPTWSVSPAGATISASGEFSATDPGIYTVTASSGALSDSAIVRVAGDNVVSITASNGFLRENDLEATTIRVSRTGTNGASLTVPLSIGGDTTAGTDHSTLPTEVVIAASAAFTEFTLSAIDDSDIEGMEWLHITPVSGGLFSIGSDGVASIAIVDDEAPTVPEPVAGPDATLFVSDSLTLGGNLLGADQLVKRGDYWKFLDDGSNQGSEWSASAFTDSAWLEGLAIFGYGDDEETTTIDFGGNSSSKHITTYFRRKFELPDASPFSALKARLLVDDGAVIYVNGSEAERINLPSGTISNTTRAQDSVGGDDETTYFEWDLDQTALVTGGNVIAVEVHQSSPSSSDLGFDLDLRAVRSTPPAGTTVRWEQQSGPGTAIFTDDTSLTSAVSFDQAGEYTLALVATSAGSSYSSEITITVDPVPNYTQWIADFSGVTSDPAADPDGDGMPSLLEFAMQTDPTDGSSRTTPVLGLDPASPTDILFSYRRLRALNPAHASGSTGDNYQLYGLSYLVQVANNLDDWQPASTALNLQPEEVPVDNGDGTETVTVRLTPPVGNDVRWFVRLTVTDG